MRAKILNASAGSGKTYQLAYKYIRDVVERPDIYRHILAVTFTNKATEEMKSRILSEIHRLASGGESPYLGDLCRELSLDPRTVCARAKEARSKILHDYSRFTILTIDTFFQRILRAFIKELGIDLNYNVEIETVPVLTKSADTLIEQITTDKELLKWLMEFVQERIDDNKKWDIRDGILSLGSELFKEKNKDALSVAKSKAELQHIVGKAIGDAKASKERMQAVAQQAVQIIAEAGLSVNDFDNKASGCAGYFYITAQGEIKGYGLRVVNACQPQGKWCAKNSPAQPLIGTLQPLLQELCTLYDTNLKLWNTADLLRENYRSFALLSDLYAKVQEMCDEENMMLLSETKYILSEFIGHNDAPFIYEKVGNRFEHFMIDEFQDTSVKEWENFLPLLQNAMAQSEQTSVLIVGDIKQSIYRWRGGDWKILHSTAQASLGEDTTVQHLENNYRSLPVIVDFNNKVIEQVVATDNEVLNNSLAQAVTAKSLQVAVQTELTDTLHDAYEGHVQTACKKGVGYVNISTFKHSPPVVERILAILDKGFSPCDILILARDKTDGAKIAALLLDFKQQNEDPRYAFDVMTQEALIVGYAPVSSFVTAAMYLALNPEDSLHRAIYNQTIGRDFDAPLTEEVTAFFHSIRLLSPEEAFERIVMEHRLQDNKLQIAYLQAIHEQIIGFCTNKIADLPLFLKWWEEVGHTRSLSVEQSERSIEITTIHKAKGLERKVVIIPYCSWQLDPKSGGNVKNIIWAEAQGEGVEAIGRFPVKFKKTMADSLFSTEYYRELVYSHVDNINLLYVALTRAKEALHIFIPQGESNIITVGKILLQSLIPTGTEVEVGGTRGHYTTTEEAEIFEFGTFAAPVQDLHAQRVSTHILLDHYPTAKADLRLRLPSQRYFEQSDEVELSPRNFGILMHKAFENAVTEEDIFEAIDQMCMDSMVSRAEVTVLRQMVDKALINPVIRDWFSGKWQMVRNENEIILPQNATTRRPDRVMINADRVVVVDYKFGKRESEKYKQQIGEYIRLLREMGYVNIIGYLWYVQLGDIDKIEA
ncbi:MAG: UvrD-helicase domain-containing protein [Alistipes sp.]